MHAILAALACISAATAQPTPEEIVEKFIQASGGRAAMEKIVSTHSKGAVTMNFAPGVTATAEFFTKAPDKYAMVMTMEGFGQVRQGFDGSVGWVEEPQSGLRELKGEELEQLKQQAIHNGALKWKQIYPKAELKGKEKIGGRDAWAVVLMPAKGKPVTQYFDCETSLLVGQTMTTQSGQGEVEVKTAFLDYRAVDGVMTPFEIRQGLPMGDMVFKFSEVRNNLAIDDATFAKPAK